MPDHPEVEVIAQLISLASRFGLRELEVEEGGLKVSLRAPDVGTEGAAGQAANGGDPYLWHAPVWAPPLADGAPGRSETAQPLPAPLTGTFYRAASPDDPPVVEVGHTVEAGQKIGLIEAMKVFSDIITDQAGVILEIVAQNGSLVQHGDVLLYLEPIAA